MTTPGQSYSDIFSTQGFAGALEDVLGIGAYQIGDSNNFGQSLTEEAISLITQGPSTASVTDAGSALTVFGQYLEQLPAEAIQFFCAAFGINATETSEIVSFVENFINILTNPEQLIITVSQALTRIVKDLMILWDVFHIEYQAGTPSDAPGTLGTNGQPTWYSAWNDLLELVGLATGTTPTTGAPTVGAGITNLLSLFGLTPSGATGTLTPSSVWTTAVNDIINPLNAIEVQASNIVGEIEQSAISGLATTLSALLGTSTFQSLLDAVANALGHSGTGHTIANIETYLGIVPTNTSGISTANTNISANTTALTQIGQIVTGASITPINTAISDFQTWWSTVTGGSTTGFAPAALPPVTMSMSPDLTTLVNNIGAALGLGSTGNTPTTVAAPLKNAVGSSMFRACATSTTSYSITGTAGAVAFPVPLNTTNYITSDYTWASSTNTLTVSTKGLYVVKIGANLSTGASNTSLTVAPILLRNGSVVRYGGSQWIHMTTTSAFNGWIADSFTIECNANDTLAPGIYQSLSSSAYGYQGESTGAQTYFEVALVRAG